MPAGPIGTLDRPARHALFMRCSSARDFMSDVSAGGPAFAFPVSRGVPMVTLRGSLPCWAC